MKYMADTHAKLAFLKINKEDKVAIVLGNGSAMACTFIAIAANYTSCPLNPSYTKEEFKFYYDDLKVKAVIIEENKSIEAREAAKELDIRIINLKSKTKSRSVELDIKTDIKNKDEYLIESDQDDIAMILHTSNT